MNKFLKSALAVAGVAGAFGVAEAQAVSFTVVIDKIEIVKDADNYPNTAFTVFNPGVGATTTVDLFDATQKLGTTFTLTKPPSGEYESVVIYFSNIKAVSGTDEVDLLAAYKAEGVAGNTGMGTLGSQGVMILGDDGAGGALDNSLETAWGTTSMAAIQSIIADGTNDITLPTLDFYLPEANLVANGSGVALTSYPRVLPAISQAADSASRANVLLQIDDGTAFTAATGWTLGASVVTVGLFDRTVPEAPLVSTTYISASPTAVKQVEFIDVPTDATGYIPLAWIDLDSDGLLDSGEYMTFHHATRATNYLPVTGVADISATTVTGILDDATGITFPGRTISITAISANVVSATAAGDCVAAADVDADTAITANAAAITGVAAAATCGAATNSSITVIYAMNAAGTISQSVELASYLSLGAQAAGGVTTIDATDSIDVLMKNTTQFGSIGNTDYIGNATVAHDHATTGRVRIVNVPAFDTDFASDLNGAAYDAAVSLSWESTTSSGSTTPETDTTTVSDAGGDVTIAIGASIANTVVIGAGAVDLGTLN